MAERLFSLADLHSKLNRSVCMYDDLPVYVICSNELIGDQVYIKSLETGKSKIVEYTEDAFSYDEITLGCINGEGCAAYAYVVPVRHSRLGLRVENISLKWPGQGRAVANMLSDKYLHDCIVGKYPTYQDALKILNTSSVGSSIAISRSMILEKINKTACAISIAANRIGFLDLRTKNLSCIPGSSEKLFFKTVRKNGVDQ